MSTFNKIYKKVANNGNSNDYQAVATVGINGVDLAVMTGASSSADGEIGLVPKPTKGNQNKYLRADGTWQTPPDTTYDVFNQTTAGLAPAVTALDNMYGTYLLASNKHWIEPSISFVSQTNGTLNILVNYIDRDDNKTIETNTMTNVPLATSSHNGLISMQYIPIFEKQRFYIAYCDCTIPVGSVGAGKSKYFNQKLENKVYQSDYPREYAVYESVDKSIFYLRYEPRFMGCSYGNIYEFSNGSNPTLVFGSDSKGKYCLITYYIVGNVMNLSGEDHTLTVKATTDFFVMKC